MAPRAPSSRGLRPGARGGTVARARCGPARADRARRILAFVDQFERRFVGQSTQRRSIIETLDLAWELLAAFPADELKRITPVLVERYRTTAQGA